MKLSAAAYRALAALETGPMTAGELGGCVWRERTGRVSAAKGGGGDFAAQMLLGRLRKAGLVDYAFRAVGPSGWQITEEGRRALENAALDAELARDRGGWRMPDG